jgi:hypothetical protein
MTRCQESDKHGTACTGLFASLRSFRPCPAFVRSLPPILKRSFTWTQRTLVSDGARDFARKYNQDGSIQLVPPESLVSEKAMGRWQYWKERLCSTGEKETEQGFHDVQDTVGAVASYNGHMSAGVSSGGLLLKCPGRIGEASLDMDFVETLIIIMIRLLSMVLVAGHSKLRNIGWLVVYPGQESISYERI